MVRQRDRAEKRAVIAVNRGAWTAEEDQRLVDYVRSHGDRNWRIIPAKAGLNRCGKSCRLRWLNYLRPGIKRGNISEDEEDLIIRLHNLLGNRWSLIAGRLPGRTDNEIKNHWNTHLSKRALTIKDLNAKLNRRPMLRSDDDDHSNAASKPTTSVRSRSVDATEEADEPSVIPSRAATAGTSWLPGEETPGQQNDHHQLQLQQQQLLLQQQELVLQQLLLQQQQQLALGCIAGMDEELLAGGLPLLPEFGDDVSWQCPLPSFAASCQHQQGAPKILFGQQQQQPPPPQQQQQFVYPGPVCLDELTGLLRCRDYYLHHP